MFGFFAPRDLPLMPDGQIDDEALAGRGYARALANMSVGTLSFVLGYGLSMTDIGGSLELSALLMTLGGVKFAAGAFQYYKTMEFEEQMAAIRHQMGPG